MDWYSYLHALSCTLQCVPVQYKEKRAPVSKEENNLLISYFNESCSFVIKYIYERLNLHSHRL